MASNSNYFTPQQYRKYNGQSVFRALSAMGNEASADELADFISEDIGARQEVILPEVKSVLQRGISNGFLKRNRKLYSFITDEHIMEVDAEPIQSRSRQWSTNTGRTPNRSRATNAEREEYYSDEEVSEEEQTDEDDSTPGDMETDSLAMPRPTVKLYEVYSPPTGRETDDEQNEESEDDDDDQDQQPPQKRIRLLPIMPHNAKKR